MQITPSDPLGKKWEQKLHFWPRLSPHVRPNCPTLAQTKVKLIQGQIENENDGADPDASQTPTIIQFWVESYTLILPKTIPLEFLVPNLATNSFVVTIAIL